MHKLNSYAGMSSGAAAVILTIGTAFMAHAQAPSGMGLVWQDEFVGAASSAQPNSSTWGFNTGGGGWGNNELETYTSNSDNAHMIWDGTGTDSQALQIKAVNSGGAWYSARITTAGKQSFGPYGYYEARCKFPNAGDGYWPAFWFLGNNIGSVGWPACGEIDVAEEINGQWQNHQSLHMPGWDPTLVTTPNSSTTTYHNYGANWQPGYVAFYVDGQYTGQFSAGGGGTWVFDNQTMYMLLNCAVGGNWPGNPDGTTQSVGYFDIDYVRQYENGASNYNYVCNENQTANFAIPEDVSYGANGSFFYRYGVNGSFTFNNTNFGGDPIFGVAKAGYARSFIECAAENGQAWFSQPVQVAYGGAGSYYYNYGTSGTVTFSNSAFGGDPAPGIVKDGYYMSYTQCAAENGSVTFSTPTNVAYGANGLYAFMNGVTGTINFNNATFGDPNPGTVKAGYFRPSH